MSLLKNYFMQFDYFGTQFQFSVLGNTKYKSLVGLLMSVCCLIMICIVTILFGRDFYNKEGPKIIFENFMTDDYKEFNLTPSNLTFAFRIEDDYGNLANFPNQLIKTTVKYLRYVYNDTTNEYNKLLET